MAFLSMECMRTMMSKFSFIIIDYWVSPYRSPKKYLLKIITKIIWHMNKVPMDIYFRFESHYTKLFYKHKNTKTELCKPP
jgi:hypothetical protein